MAVVVCLFFTSEIVMFIAAQGQYIANEICLHKYML